MNTRTGPGVLITGATSGIGRELARQLHHAGNNVLAHGRDPRRLDDVARELPGVHTALADVTQPDQVRALADAATALPGGLQLLINNAAVQHHQNFLNDPVDDLVDDAVSEIATNLTGLVSLTARCLPALRAAPTAVVVNLTTGLILSPKRRAPVYCATKAAVHTFTTALRHQTRRDAPHIQVVEAVLPVVDTPMTAGRGTGKLPPDRVARDILRAVTHHRDRVDIGRVRTLRVLHRLSPVLAEHILRDT